MLRSLPKGNKWGEVTGLGFGFMVWDLVVGDFELEIRGIIVQLVDIFVLQVPNRQSLLKMLIRQ